MCLNSLEAVVCSESVTLVATLLLVEIIEMCKCFKKGSIAKINHPLLMTGVQSSYPVQGLLGYTCYRIEFGPCNAMTSIAASIHECISSTRS